MGLSVGSGGADGAEPEPEPVEPLRVAGERATGTWRRLAAALLASAQRRRRWGLLGGFLRTVTGLHTARVIEQRSFWSREGRALRDIKRHDVGRR